MINISRCKQLYKYIYKQQTYPQRNEKIQNKTSTYVEYINCKEMRPKENYYIFTHMHYANDIRTGAKKIMLLR